MLKNLFTTIKQMIVSNFKAQKIEMKIKTKLKLLVGPKYVISDANK